jgi:hypothetical protein
MSIKNYISIIILLLIQFNLSAQKDTAYQTIRQENGEYNAPLIETPADRAFRTKVPSKWMFKMNLAQTVLSSDNRTNSSTLGDGVVPLGFAAEYKLFPGFSIGAYLGMALGFQPKSHFNDQKKWLFSESFSVEGRWYHDMKKRIQKGKGANNFGGRYFALEAGISNNNSLNNTWDDRRIALRYGLQQRFMRNGYFDISIGAGISDPSPILKRPKVFSTDQRVAVGLAAFLPKSKSKVQSGGLCDVLHCQDEQYKMLKINLFNVLNFQSNGDVYNIEFRPNIAFERKIGRSPFSIEVDVETDFSNSKIQYYDGADPNPYSARFTSANWNATGELRWYHSMRKRILNGRSGNNLSGAFFGLQVNRNNLIKNAVSIKSEKVNSIFDNSTITGDYWAGNLVWGIQQRLLDRGFIQFKIGAGSTFGGTNYRYEGQNKPMTKIGRSYELNIIADLKVGFAF